jgi:beta-phosphoglucomutase
VTRLGPYAAFLFDLDGVLVRSEQLHWEAYRQTCAARGRDLPWSFERYCLAAHYGSERLQEELSRELPGLLDPPASWQELYREKSGRYLALLASQSVTLQPGAAATLERLASLGALRAVATNSTREQTSLLRRQHPVLDMVPVWVTREDYTAAKPAPDAYLTALSRLSDPAPDVCLGFEDTPRGLQALVRAGVDAVLVTPISYPKLGGVQPRATARDLASLPSGLLP